MTFLIEANHRRWAKNSKRRYGRSQQYYLDIIAAQKGRCAFSGAQLIFDPEFGTATKKGGCHALYAALDHSAPGHDDCGHCIVSYALNDIKGHLPYDCFIALRRTGAWKRFMADWRSQALRDPLDSQALYALRHKRNDSKRLG